MATPCADGPFVRQKIQVPGRDVMAVQPFDRLLDSDAMKELDKQTVRDDSNSDAVRREPTEILAVHRQSVAAFETAPVG